MEAINIAGSTETEIVGERTDLEDPGPEQMAAPTIATSPAKTNCTVRVNMPNKTPNADYYTLCYSADMDLPVDSWIELPTQYTTAAYYDFTGLIEDTHYFFCCKAYNEISYTFGRIVGTTMLSNPSTATPTVSNVTAETANVNWPTLPNCAIEARFYVKNLDSSSSSSSDGFVLNKTFTGANLIIDGLQADSKYLGKMSRLFPGNKEEFSAEVAFTTLVHTPNKPEIASRDGNFVTIAAPVYKSDWKRLDLEKKVGSDWVVVDTMTSSVSIADIFSYPSIELRFTAYGDYSQVSSDSLNIDGVNISPLKVGAVALSTITETSMVATVPTLPVDADYIKILYSLNPFTGWITLPTNYSGGEDIAITGLTANTFYYFKAEAHNTYGKATSVITYASTIPVGGTPDTEAGEPPVVDYEITQDGRVKITAPDVDQWPINTRYLILEVREIIENNLSPETDLWVVAKTQVHIGDEFIVAKAYTIKGLDYEFRWIAKNDGV
jgi:hypothetical protein